MMVDIILNNLERLVANPKLLFLIGSVFVVNGLAAFTRNVLLLHLNKINFWAKTAVSMSLPGLFSFLVAIPYVLANYGLCERYIAYTFLYTFVIYALSLFFYDVFYKKWKEWAERTKVHDVKNTKFPEGK